MERASNINPDILRWARETAGLSMAEAASKIGLGDTKKSSGVDKLRALEIGERKPTRNQLVKIASVYRRPLTVFYRRTPPEAGDRGQDFRTQTDPVSENENARLDTLLRDVRARQNMVRSLLEDDPDAQEIDFIGTMGVNEDVSECVERLRRYLGVFDALETTRPRNPEDLFRTLRQRVEHIGVFVLLIGDLGSPRYNPISPSVFRGFAIADRLAPFIVINDRDAKPAWSFTLLHELTHLFVGTTGVSGAPTTLDPETSTARIERFCNDVASEFLLPASYIPPAPDFASKAEAAAFVAEIADTWNVSEPLVAYRMWRTGLLGTDRYRELAGDYRARWQNARKKNRDDDSGPTYFTVRRHRLGHALLGLVKRNLRENELTHTKAAKVLGVRPGNVEPLLSKINSIPPS